MNDDRKKIAQELNLLEQAIRELEITYEQYFAGVEKREPVKDREKVARMSRLFANRRIMQTDLRFRYQNLATRFHSYSGYWDRILRLMDEGRYHRQKGSMPAPPKSPPLGRNSETGRSERPSEADALYQQLQEARRACNMNGSGPDRTQVASFLEQQKSKIREKFGDREVEFRVVLENNQPKIRVRPKG
ncbi:MAG: hypothetical protein C0621_10290 [Desulfuromonas sp.]|nr:MAG: hypothetical protein C0621_10290 [Desulfuromonas sp.]